MAQFEYVEWLIEWLYSQEDFIFDWDDGNATKNYLKHRIAIPEAEQIFKNIGCMVPLGIQISPKSNEPRFGVLGITLDGKMLSAVFTTRTGMIRIISIRAMSLKERMHYVSLRKK
ncbi:MAG: BrnT family toxin [Deltaproteobacteria bacterium]|nr:BrnT family toxin [Deltaproteobacteria bacterium]